MFWVNETQEDRHARIREFLSNDDVVIALILACADFEWTSRRAIVALSDTANVEVRKELESVGFGQIPKCWQQFVTPKTKKKISDLVCDWEVIRPPRRGEPRPSYGASAFDTRNQLVHGNATSLSLEKGTLLVDALLNGALAIAQHCTEFECPIYGERLRVVTTTLEARND